MSREFSWYLLIAVGGWLVALVVVKPRNAFDLSRCVGWYLLVFVATYVIRPAASQMIGDTFLYDVLRIGTFEQHWYLMAVAVPLAILSFSAGYAFGAPTGGALDQTQCAHDSVIVGQQQVKTLIFWLLVWGYFVSIITFGMGHSGAGEDNIAGANLGVYDHGTAWFAQGDIYVSVACLLHYILTGRLGWTLLFAGPWLASRIALGWGRNNIVAFLFGLMAIHFGRNSRTSRPELGKAILLMLAAFVFIVVFFPLLSVTRALSHEKGLGARDAFDIALHTKMSAADILDALLSTHSSITGFELSLYHILVDKRPHLGTEYLYYYFIQPIPRIIWHGKGSPYEWPYWLLGIDWDPIPALAGQAAGSIGHAFMEWGWTGIVAEFLFTGFLMRWAEERARRKTDAAYAQLAYAGFYGILPGLGRESVLTMLAFKWLQVYGLTVIILWFIHRAAQARTLQAMMRLTRGAKPAASI
jgi:hypothetical protein